jgi:hypothetical protein
VITSRLSEETKILAQEVARLDAEARAARAAGTNGDAANGHSEPPAEQAPEAQPGSSARAPDQ